MPAVRGSVRPIEAGNMEETGIYTTYRGRRWGVNDLPQITNENTKIILYADGTSLIITNPNPTNFENNVNKIFQEINRWFDTNLLSLNLDKTHYMQFVNKNCPPFDLIIGQGNKKITNTCTTKFLGLTLENMLSWKTHIDTIVPKLSSATFAIRTVKPYLSQDSLKMMYYSYFHSVMTWNNFGGKLTL